MNASRLKHAIPAACALFALPACADPTAGAYLGIQGGPNWEQSQNLMQDGKSFVNAKLATGFASGITTGWQFASGLRLELELDYRRNKLQSFNSRLYDGGGSIDANGFETAFTGFGNVWYDFRTAMGVFSTVHPFIGGGIGVAHIGVRNLEAGGVRFGNASATMFAYQLGAGIDYDVTPRLTLSMGYRFMRTSYGSFGSIPYLPPTEVRARYTAQSILFSLRYAIGS